MHSFVADIITWVINITFSQYQACFPCQSGVCPKAVRACKVKTKERDSFIFPWQHRNGVMVANGFSCQTQVYSTTMCLALNLQDGDIQHFVRLSAS